MNNKETSKAKKQKTFSEQDTKVNVKDYPSTIELTNMLKGINYPSDKDKIINSVIGKDTDKKISELLGQIKDTTYKNSSEVIYATGLVKK